MTDTEAESLTRDDLVATHLMQSDLLGLEEGDECWLPVSPVRGDTFRAIRVEVKERRSAGGYEEKCAIEPWDEDAERMGANPTLAGEDD